ncbi:MAG: haloacid dehalogenase-like hydrolase [Atopobiaceae bacterium]|nr:haloacid dehalogenase-like hydrolase [Atopobiaceae bacterium]
MKQTNRPFLTILALALAVVLGLGACGNTAQQSNGAKSDDAAATTEETATEATATEEAATEETADATATTETADAAAATETAAVDDATALDLWADDSPTAALVKEYVADVTDEKSPNFIPAEDRLCTIDWDGTLFGELDPIYFDWAMYIHRVLWDSTYEPTPEQVEVAHQIEEVEQTRSFPDGLEAQHAKYLAEAFKGMSVEDFRAYVAEFGETDAPKFTGLKRKDSYYKPMVQLVNYLHDNGFDCYVVSGTDRNVLRELIPAYFPWMDDVHIKGSVSTVEASGQKGADGLEYTWTPEDELVLGGELVIKDVKANKPSIIATEIGKQPVVSLGNSSGDSSMANYCVNNNKYKSLALMLCCDDTDRDWGEIEKAESMVKSCKENGWHAVSQKDEWKTFFGDEVKLDKEWTFAESDPNQAGPNAREASFDAAGTPQAEEEVELAEAA